MVIQLITEVKRRREGVEMKDGEEGCEGKERSVMGRRGGRV